LAISYERSAVGQLKAESRPLIAECRFHLFSAISQSTKLQKNPKKPLHLLHDFINNQSTNQVFRLKVKGRLNI